MNLSEFLGDHRHVQLVEWLTTPDAVRRELGLPLTQVAFAESLGVSPRTVRDWKAREDVRKAWSKQADLVVGDPSNIQEVLEEMRSLALDRQNSKQVQAAKLYLEAVDAVKPKAEAVEVKFSMDQIRQLSDEELDRKIVEQMAIRAAEDAVSGVDL
jgi:hypothetical protein